jgi:putative phosphoribosyl transferase
MRLGDEGFRDRVAAGRLLAPLVVGRVGTEEVVVLALPRGGVPVAAEVARALGAPLDVGLVRKLGLPSQHELAMGAIGEEGVRVLDHDLVRRAGVTTAQLAAVEARERAELGRRIERYRGLRPMTSLAGKTAVIVDDGIATGATARAACAVVRAHGAQRVVLAAPVAARSTLDAMREVADDVVCVTAPSNLRAIGEWYDDFGQTSDAEVVAILSSFGDVDLELDLGAVRLCGRLVVPPAAAGVVLFAHGSESSRNSPRNRYVAEVLQSGGIATLLFDLLTPSEEGDRANVFDIDLLGARLADATRVLRRDARVADLPIGYFGASTGAAAALWAASESDLTIGAVVSRGGRPDLAGSRLGRVTAPTLLIVGGADDVVVELNRDAAARLRCEHRIEIVAGATHLFEERGALQTVASLALDWFGDHLGR